LSRPSGRSGPYTGLIWFNPRWLKWLPRNGPMSMRNLLLLLLLLTNIRRVSPSLLVVSSVDVVHCFTGVPVGVVSCLTGLSARQVCSTGSRQNPTTTKRNCHKTPLRQKPTTGETMPSTAIFFATSHRNHTVLLLKPSVAVFDCADTQMVVPQAGLRHAFNLTRCRSSPTQFLVIRL